MNFYTEIMAKERSLIYESTGKVCSELSRTPEIPWKKTPTAKPLPPIPKNESIAMLQMRKVFNTGQLAKAIEYIKCKPIGWLFTAREIESAGFYHGICQRLQDHGTIEIAIHRKPGINFTKYRRVK